MKSLDPLTNEYRPQEVGNCAVGGAPTNSKRTESRGPWQLALIEHEQSSSNLMTDKRAMPEKRYKLLDRNGQLYQSLTKGALGGYRRGARSIYGRLDCKNALRWIAAGHYVLFRVFFADEATAIAAGFEPCGKCMRQRHRDWKAGRHAGQTQPRA